MSLTSSPPERPRVAGQIAVIRFARRRRLAALSSAVCSLLAAFHPLREGAIVKRVILSICLVFSSVVAADTPFQLLASRTSMSQAILQ
jgi:hypothetical protein